ncbi:MAG: hypothetical protein Q8908_05040 [Bacteroidota bacterium]|nr:hypothetical protein [Bacteroidota bacterium]
MPDISPEGKANPEHIPCISVAYSVTAIGLTPGYNRICPGYAPG